MLKIFDLSRSFRDPAGTFRPANVSQVTRGAGLNMWVQYNRHKNSRSEVGSWRVRLVPSSENKVAVRARSQRWAAFRRCNSYGSVKSAQKNLATESRGAYNVTDKCDTKKPTRRFRGSSHGMNLRVTNSNVTSMQPGQSKEASAKPPMPVK